MTSIVASITRPAGLGRAASLVRAAGLDRRTAGILAGIAIAVVAWLVSIALALTGNAGALHHHTLIEHGSLPLWLAAVVFLAGWQLMTASMMLPASLRAVGVVAASRFVARPAAALLGFLGAYALVWSGFGLAAFVGDIGLHHLVDTTPWLAAHQSLIAAGSLALAGAYQFAPWRLAALEACRHPARRITSRAREVPPAAIGRSRFAASRLSDLGAGFRVGLAHGLDCLASSWALMLLMFAVGVANLEWMAVLALVMAYEALGGHGRLAGQAFGGLLLALGGLVVLGLPAGF